MKPQFQAKKDLNDGCSRFSLKTILVPVDFSPGSRIAMTSAIRLAMLSNARVVALHVLDAAKGKSKLEMQRKLRAFVRKGAPGAVVKTVDVRAGLPFQEIVKTAKRIEADLIVIATNRHWSASRTALGSTTDYVVRHAHCPVLVVRQFQRDFIGKPSRTQMVNVVVLTDLSASSTNLLRHAACFAKSFNGRILLLHICEPVCCDVEFNYYQADQENAEKLKSAQARLAALAQEIEKEAITVTPICAVGDVCRGIREVVEKEEAGLIILTGRGQFGLPDFCRSSVTEEVIACAKCPVLVLREAKRGFVRE